MTNIQSVFDGQCSSVVFDAALAKRLAQYQAGFRTKNEDHIRFFGGKLIGVDIVRFTPSDRATWFGEILKCDDPEVTAQLHDLPTINPNFFVSSDAMNLSCVWLIHRLQTSKLPDKVKTDAMIDVALVLQYKYLTSWLQHSFRYQPVRSVMEATYAGLSNKFLIKKYDSWYALLRAQADTLVKHNSLHWRAISKMDDDAHVVNLVNDVQGRIRSLLRNYYGEFMLVHKQGIKIVSTSASVMSFDGKEILKDRSSGLQNYTRYIQSVVADERSFVRSELVALVERIMPSMNPRLFETTLKWMSENYRHTKTGDIDELLGETLLHSFGYLAGHTTMVSNTHDLLGLVTALRGTYMASRNSDPVLLGLRERGERVVQKATGNKNPNTVSAVRTGLLLYICLRTYTSSYYAQLSLG